VVSGREPTLVGSRAHLRNPWKEEETVVREGHRKKKPSRADIDLILTGGAKSLSLGEEGLLKRYGSSADTGMEKADA